MSLDQPSPSSCPALVASPNSHSRRWRARLGGVATESAICSTASCKLDPSWSWFAKFSSLHPAQWKASSGLRRLSEFWRSAFYSKILTFPPIQQKLNKIKIYIQWKGITKIKFTQMYCQTWDFAHLCPIPVRTCFFLQTSAQESLTPSDNHAYRNIDQAWAKNLLLRHLLQSLKRSWWVLAASPSSDSPISLSSSLSNDPGESQKPVLAASPPSGQREEKRLKLAAPTANSLRRLSGLSNDPEEGALVQQ